MWGCLAHVAIPGPKRTKLRPKTQESVFLGYALHRKAYRILVIHGQDKDSIIESTDAVFFEDCFPFKQVVSGTSGTDRRPAQVIESGSKESVDVEPCRSKRPRKETSFGPDFLTYILESDPASYQEAMQSPDAAFWKEALNSEIEFIFSNHTGEL